MSVALDVEYAQELCDLIVNDLGYGCSFMGEGGVIIACGVRERIGTVHSGAARIMRHEVNEYRVTKEEAEASGGKLREGISMGIDFEGKRVATLGIAGALERVVPLAQVMSLFIRSMIARDQADTGSSSHTLVPRHLEAPRQSLGHRHHRHAGHLHGGARHLHRQRGHAAHRRHALRQPR
jgi:sugar diacid utilization regulator